jgi:hypothetical protein
MKQSNHQKSESKNSKDSKRKVQSHMKGTLARLIADFSAEILQVKREEVTHLKF